MQSTVRVFQASGLAGEIARKGPLRSEPWNLDSSGTTQTFGFGFTQSADGVAEVGGTGAFLGFLVNPKEHPLIGDGSNALAAVNSLPDNAVGELASMGIFFIALTEAGNVGDALNMVEATGAIGVGAAGAGEQDIDAKIIIEDIPGAGLAIVQIG